MFEPAGNLDWSKLTDEHGRIDPSLKLYEKDGSPDGGYTPHVLYRDGMMVSHGSKTTFVNMDRLYVEMTLTLKDCPDRAGWWATDTTVQMFQLYGGNTYSWSAVERKYKPFHPAPGTLWVYVSPLIKQAWKEANES